MTKLIIPEFVKSRNRIVRPTIADYEFLGIPVPASLPKLHVASLEDTKRLTGIDNSVGIPLVKKGFFGDKFSRLYAPSQNDYKKLGTRWDFVVTSDGEVHNSTYSVKDGVAYIQDPHGSLVESFALSPDVFTRVENEGVVSYNLLSASPLSRITLVSPSVAQFREKHGIRACNARYPTAGVALSRVHDSKLSGITSNGLEYYAG
ncbi:hypothetical protein GOV12_00550 [Candidatus Pacearchaeota archaeon]|nr:hypothetical protein [Candidatus Pacearchaeota archaeon]